MSNTDGVGFWTGFWHGLILPISFLISLFRTDVGIYQIANNGAWYDFGFLVGVLLLGMLLFESGSMIVYVRADKENEEHDGYIDEEGEEP
jgi:hypothetical protein